LDDERSGLDEEMCGVVANKVLLPPLFYQ
jgi:hypothetical protein